jgi:hypothetical protein
MSSSEIRRHSGHAVLDFIWTNPITNHRLAWTDVGLVLLGTEQNEEGEYHATMLDKQQTLLFIIDHLEVLSREAIVKLVKYVPWAVNELDIRLTEKLNARWLLEELAEESEEGAIDE